jgi:tRNA threonylcarbamoyladenosine biosynthesis protein TsaB
MGEVYHAAYVRDASGLNEACAPGVYRPEAVPPLPAGAWVGCGSGFAAHAAVLAGRYGAQLAAIRAEVSPSAAAMLRLAGPRFERGEGRDAASAAPIYLRDKVALKTSERAGKHG